MTQTDLQEFNKLAGGIMTDQKFIDAYAKILTDNGLKTTQAFYTETSDNPTLSSLYIPSGTPTPKPPAPKSVTIDESIVITNLTDAQLFEMAQLTYQGDAKEFYKEYNQTLDIKTIRQVVSKSIGQRTILNKMINRMTGKVDGIYNTELQTNPNPDLALIVNSEFNNFKTAMTPKPKPKQSITTDDVIKALKKTQLLQILREAGVPKYQVSKFSGKIKNQSKTNVSTQIKNNTTAMSIVQSIADNSNNTGDSIVDSFNKRQQPQPPTPQPQPSQPQDMKEFLGKSLKKDIEAVLNKIYIKDKKVMSSELPGIKTNLSNQNKSVLVNLILGNVNSKAHSVFKVLTDYYNNTATGGKTIRRTATYNYALDPTTGFGMKLTKKSQYKKGGNKTDRMNRLKQLLSDL